MGAPADSRSEKAKISLETRGPRVHGYNNIRLPVAAPNFLFQKRGGHAKRRCIAV